MKYWEKNRKDFLEKHIEKIKKYKDDLPDRLEKRKKVKNNTWFNVDESEVKYSNKSTYDQHKDLIYEKQKDKEIYNSIRIKLILTDDQKAIIDNWQAAYTEMYNKALIYIGTLYPILKQRVSRKKLLPYVSNKNRSKNINLNNIKIRKQLETTRNNIINKYKNPIPIHSNTLDFAIDLIIGNYKSAITNTINNNFKQGFHIKKWKETRPSQNIQMSRSNTICTSKKNKGKLAFSKLGDLVYQYNGKQYNHINLIPFELNGTSFKINKIESDYKIGKNLIRNEYYVLISKKNLVPTKEPNNNNTISLDPGLRVFMTALSNKKALFYGTNVDRRIKQKLRKINNIKNSKKISKSKKRKYERKYNIKIENLTNELHWKVM